MHFLRRLNRQCQKMLLLRLRDIQKLQSQLLLPNQISLLFLVHRCDLILLHLRHRRRLIIHLKLPHNLLLGCTHLCFLHHQRCWLNQNLRLNRQGHRRYSNAVLLLRR